MFLYKQNNGNVNKIYIAFIGIVNKTCFTDLSYQGILSNPKFFSDFLHHLENNLRTINNKSNVIVVFYSSLNLESPATHRFQNSFFTKFKNFQNKQQNLHKSFQLMRFDDKFLNYWNWVINSRIMTLL